MGRKKVIRNGIVISGVILVFFFMVLLIYGMNAKRMSVQVCFYRNEQSFDKIVAYFSDMYEPSLVKVEYDLEPDALVKCFEEETITAECKKEIVYILRDWNEKYQPRNENYVFTNIAAFYDSNGSMLLRIKVKSELISSEEYRHYYLVYIDKNYSGHSSDLHIDSYDVEKKPFSGNWYTWSTDVPRG